MLYKLNHLSAGYGDNIILSDINLTFQQSAITALVGPNGSGKTTLLNVLAFMLWPTSGWLEYQQQHVTATRLEKYKKAVAYVQQNPYLIRGTALKNVELGLKLRHVSKSERSRRAANVMRLLGINDLAERHASSLSGGEAQKVAIAQMMVLEPDVLILDEPFTYLDKHAINELEQLIVKLKDELKKTVIFTTHNQHQAQHLADHVYSVIKGKVFESSLLNLFSGELNSRNQQFHTECLSMTVPEKITEAEHIAIDPVHIFLSNEKPDPEMQNSFLGKVTTMIEDDKQVKISVDVGEHVQTVVSHKTLDDLQLSIGKAIWISFKSSSIIVF